MKSPRILASTVALFLLATGIATAQQPQHYLILSKSQGKGSVAFGDRVAAAGGSIDATLENIGVVLASSSNPNFISNLAGAAGVQNIAVDEETQWIKNEQAMVADEASLEPSGLNSEPFYAGYQWTLRNINADKTAAAGYQGQGAIVAVLDAGMILNHPDLKANIDAAHAISFVPGEGVNPPAGIFNHGSHVGGIIAAPINNIGIQGVAPQATLVPIKVLRASGSGSFGWLIEGLAYAESIHADVANMSLGATFVRNPNVGCPVGTSTKECNSGTLMAALNRAINHATQAGVLCVSAAGNEGVDLNSGIVSIPAQSGNGIAVSATGPVNQANFDRLASYSNYGQSVVNVAAPGGDFVSGNAKDYVLAPGGYTVNSVTGAVSYQFYFAVGTSMAAPHVSGLAAVLVSKYGHIGPTRLKTLIENSATDILSPGNDAQSGKGRIDAAAAAGIN